MSTLLVSVSQSQNISPHNCQNGSSLLQIPPESAISSPILEVYQSRLKTIRNQVSSLSKDLVKIITLNCDSFLSKLSDIESRLSNLAKCSKSPSIVLYYLEKTIKNLPDLSRKISSLSSSVSDFFLFSDCETFPVPDNLMKDFAFSFNQHTGAFNRIELESLCSTKQATYPKFACSFSAGTSLGFGQFFLHGGSQKYEASSETCVYDLYLDQVMTLPRSNCPRNGNACVRKDSKIYVFGSTYPVSRVCEVFDLKKMAWIKINPLPKKTLFMTGSSFNENILVTGAGVYGYWKYDCELDSYEIIEGYSAGYKIIFDHYLLTSEGIFDLEDERINEGLKFKSDWLVSPLSLTIITKYKEKYYFIDCHLNLIRFDPISKSTAILKY